MLSEVLPKNISLFAVTVFTLLVLAVLFFQARVFIAYIAPLLNLFFLLAVAKLAEIVLLEPVLAGVLITSPTLLPLEYQQKLFLFDRGDGDFRDELLLSEHKL